MDAPIDTTLLGLSNEVAHIYSAIADSGGEIDEQTGLLLDELEKHLRAKVDAYAHLVHEFSARGEAQAKEAKRLADKAAANAAAVKKLKARLQVAMERLGVKRLEGELHKIRIQNNGGLLPLEVDETKVPPVFCEMKLVPNQTLIRDAIAKGEKLDFAKLGERGVQVRVE